MTFRTVGTMVAALIGSTPIALQAEPSAGQVLKEIDRGDATGRVVKLILDGYAIGFSVINEELRHRGRPMIYCAPRRLAITADQNANILRDYLKDHPSVEDMPAALTLLQAYILVFPCDPES